MEHDQVEPLLDILVSKKDKKIYDSQPSSKSDSTQNLFDRQKKRKKTARKTQKKSFQCNCHRSKAKPCFLHQSASISDQQLQKNSRNMVRPLDSINPRSGSLKIDLLISCYKIFNRNQMIQKVHRAFELDPRIHLNFPTIIRYIARKYELPRFLLQPILHGLKNRDLDLKVRINLTQAVKYGVRNDLDVKFEDLFDVIGEDSDEIKSEIAWALGYKVQNCGQELTADLIDKIRSSITAGMASKATNFLKDQLARHGDLICDQGNQEKANNPAMLGKNLKKRSRTIITKNQQFAKNRHTYPEAQESTFEIAGILEALKNQQNKIRLNTGNMSFPPEKEGVKGSDLSFFQKTYASVKTLYDLARADKIIKDQDKDKYLTNKFLSNTKLAKWGTGGLLGNLITDWMIAEIFSKISQRQTLDPKTIAKLMLCLENSDSLAREIYPMSNVFTETFKLFSKNPEKSEDISPSQRVETPEVISLREEQKRRIVERLLCSNVSQPPQAMQDIADKINSLKNTKELPNSDREKVWSLFLEAINKIKRAAISALYQCACRNSKILTLAYLKKVQVCLEDEDRVVRSFAIRILALVNDSQEIDYNLVFSSCLKQLEENTEIDDSLDFIDQQSKDPKRCENLFTDEVIFRLSNFLKNPVNTYEQKTHCNEIINNSLAYPKSGLKLEALENICLVFSESDSSDEKLKILKEKALISILLTAEKDHSLSNSVTAVLVERLSSFDDYQKNLTVIIFRMICDHVNTSISCIDEISSKLLDDQVIIGKGSNLTFERLTKSNSSDYPTISAFVAEIVLSFTKKGNQISSIVRNNLIETLFRDEHQTRILAAKIIYFAANHNLAEFKEDVLVRLETFLEDKVPGVAIYCICSYTKILSTLSQKKISPRLNYMDVLAKVYAFEELKLGDEDFSAQVNKNIFDVLANQVTKQTFSENIFSIFDYIFKFDSPYKTEALDIVKAYLMSQQQIPEGTVLAIEDVLVQPEYANEALKVLEKVIENGQRVSDKALQIFADNLYLNNNEPEKDTDRDFKVLEIAESNQDLSDEIFAVLELERAGLLINSNHPEDALTFLEIQTQAGRKLPSNVLKALNKQIIDPKTWPILINITANGQLLPSFLIKKISKRLDPQKKQSELIKIFFNLAKNNQDIPEDLLDQLEKRLEKKANSDETLLIFAYRAQKGEILSQKLINKISDKFFSTINQSIKQECLSALCSILQTHRNISHEFIEKVLVHGISDENEQIVFTSLKGFEALRPKAPFTEETTEALVRKATNLMCPHDLKQRIAQLLDSKSLNDSQSNRLKLATLDCESELDILKTFSKNGGKLLEQNFQQINLIINGSVDFHKATLCLHALYFQINEIPEYLIHSIVNLTFRTSNQELRDQGIFLVQEIIKAERKLPEKSVSLVCAQQDTSEFLLKDIRKNQEIPKAAELLLKLDSIVNSKESDGLSSLLKNILIEFDHGLKITNNSINHLIFLAESNQASVGFEEFALIFSRAILQDSQYIEKEKIVEVIEKAILEIKEVDLTIVQAFRKLIPTKKCTRLLESLDSLVDLLLKKQSEKEYLICFEIFLCAADAAISGNFCEKSLQLLESNISNPNVRIRRKCFQGLRAGKDNGYQSGIFEAYCASLLETLKSQTEIQIDSDLDLLETLASVEYLDLGKLKQLPQNRWIQGLLISDIFAHFKSSYDQRIILLKKWSRVEDHARSQNLNPNKILKALSESRPSIFKNLEQVMIFLLKIDLEKACDILLESLHPFQELKLQWLVGLLNKCLRNQQASQNFIQQLASKINLKLTTPIISKLFSAISAAENAIELESLFDFAAENNIQAHHIDPKKASIKNLKKSLGIKLLHDQVRSSIKSDKFAAIIDNLFDNGWLFENLIEIFKKTDSFSAFETRIKEQSLLQIIRLLSDYKISGIAYAEILNILNNNVEVWVKAVNEIAVEMNFQATSKVKNHVELIAELKKMNPENTSLQDLIEVNLAENMMQIKDPKLMSLVDSLKLPISEWTKTEISAWARIMKSDAKGLIDSIYFVESLAVIKRANFLHSGFHLTDVQILSCIAQLKVKPTQGRLLQVGTGEGKSTIISVIAIVHALQGKKVDIITSSPVLAERDAKQIAGLYKMFDLSCMDNADKFLYIKGPKNCYKQDIVYGEIAQFQFDTLRDKYSMLDTLAKRENQVAIIDEVDSMLIDDSSNIARLSSTIAGMDRFQFLLHLLWQKLNLLQKRFIVVKGKNYLISDEAAKIPNLKDSIHCMEDVDNVAFEIEGDVETLFRNLLEKYVREDLIGKEKVTIPENFKEFVNTQIPKWIDNAIRALMMQENQQYVIQDGLVKPVAYDSTGIVQSATCWGDGLHQFIQLKHGLKMTSETLTTNFLSNIGYIQKYGKRLFGLTGTLGSKKAKEVLSYVYDVDLVMIPNLHRKQYLEHSTITCQSHIQWLEEICESALHEVSKERGVLIICQTIEHCKLIGSELGKKYRSGAIKLYTMNNMNQERNIDKINPGEIIVATNLAGRGTDIKTEKIEKTGGLHVIVTFLPTNQRVEDQAFGRTARQGKRGTGQMILNRIALTEYEDACPEKIKDIRDDFESSMFDEFLQKELEMVNTKDQLFGRFCELKDLIRRKCETSYWESIRSLGSSVYETNVLNALEERWALFLHNIDNQAIPPSNSCCHQKYDRFQKEISQDFIQNQLIKNPSYHINIANGFLGLRRLGHTKFDFEQAGIHYDKAIKLDPKHSAAAYTGKAWLAIVNKEKKDLSKDQIREEFDQCIKLLSAESSELLCCQKVLQQEYPNMECDLSKQLIQKINILGSAINSLENNKSIIKKSQRLFDITGITRFQRNSKSEKKGENEIERKDYSTTITKRISTIFELEKDPKRNQLDKDFENQDEFTLSFHDLTPLPDNRDQAIETISNVLSQTLLEKILKSSALDSSKYHNLSLNLNTLDADDLRAKLKPDIHIRDVDREVAILKLKTKFAEVDLESIDGKKSDSRTGLKAEEALKLIKEQKNKGLKYNMLLKKANDTAKSLQKDILKNSTLELEYTNLNSQTARNKLSHVNSDRLHLEILGTKEEILQALLNPSLECVQLLISEDIIEAYYIDVARSKISEMKSDLIWVKIEDLNPKVAAQIISVCPSATFEMTFIGVKLSQIVESLEQEPMKLSFTKLSPGIAQKLIPILRNASLEFTLQFSNLTIQQVYEVIKKASLKQEDLNINKVSRLSDLSLESERPNLELAEFSARGIEYLLEINEKRFIPWRSILTVVCMGTLQIALGAALIATGFGASAGLGLITEGGADYLTALIAYKKRQFRWIDYAQQKAVSLVISATMLGTAKFKDGYQGVKNLMTASTNFIGQTGTQIAVGNQFIGQQALQALNSAKGLIIPHIASVTSQVIIRHSFNTIADSLFKFCLEKFRPDISSYVRGKVQDKFSEESFKTLINKMRNLDKTRKSDSLFILIKTTLHRIICPENPQNQGLWNSIGKPVCNNILSDPRIIGSDLSIGLRIVGTLSGLAQIAEMIDSTYNQLFEKLSEIDQSSLSIHQLLHKDCKINLPDAKEIAKLLKSENVIETYQYRISNKNAKELSIGARQGFDHFREALQVGANKGAELLGIAKLNLNSCESINPTVFEIISNIDERNRGQNPAQNCKRAKVIKRIREIDFVKQEQYKDVTFQFLEDMHTAALNMSSEDVNEIIRLTSDIITEQIIRVIESHLISPWSTYGVAKFVNNASAMIQNHFNNDYRDQLESEIKAEENKMAKLQEKEHKTKAEENKIEDYKFEITEKRQFAEKPYITYADQISYEANKYEIAYTQCQNLYYAQHPSEESREHLSKGVHHRANEIRESKAANATEMMSMASFYGEKIKIVDDPDYVPTSEDKAQHFRIVLFTPGAKHDDVFDVGHYQLLDSNGNPCDISSKDNDCGFAVMSAILKDDGINVSINELRHQLAEMVEHNSYNYTKILENEHWVASHCPEKANKILFVGGSLGDVFGLEREYKGEVTQNDIIEEKTWHQTCHEAAKILEAVTLCITKAGDVILKATGNVFAPIIVPVITAASVVRVLAISYDTAYEIIQSGFENGVLSWDFCQDAFHKVAGHSHDLIKAALRIKLNCMRGMIPILKKLKEPAEKLEQIDLIIRTYFESQDSKKDANEENKESEKKQNLCKLNSVNYSEAELDPGISNIIDSPPQPQNQKQVSFNTGILGDQDEYQDSFEIYETITNADDENINFYWNDTIVKYVLERFS